MTDRRAEREDRTPGPRRVSKEDRVAIAALLEEAKELRNYENPGVFREFLTYGVRYIPMAELTEEFDTPEVSIRGWISGNDKNLPQGVLREVVGEELYVRLGMLIFEPDGPEEPH